MLKRNKINFMVTGGLFLLSIIFILVIKTMDVQPIGPNLSKVGLATFNQSVFNQLGTNLTWYDITDKLGIIALLFAFVFAVIGLIQWITRKSIKKVERSILLLGGFYVLVLMVYGLFEILIVNYRPIILEGVLEASFPSSHTMLVFCIMTTTLFQFKTLIKNKHIRFLLNGLCILILFITIIGRFISGVHWATDIIGGLLIGSTLVMLYYSLVTYSKNK